MASCPAARHLNPFPQCSAWQRQYCLFNSWHGSAYATSRLRKLACRNLLAPTRLALLRQPLWTSFGGQVTFDVDPFLFNDAPILDVLDLYCSEGVEGVRLRSPLRFDYDIKNQRDFHPASHLTFVSESCRWAVAFPLSPGHFTRFIFHHFYPVHWSNFRFIRNWPQQQRERTITAHEEKLLHIASAS